LTTITKIFVILVCLFAFIFTPIAVHFAATSYEWKDLAEQYRDVSATALARELNAIAVTTSEIQHHRSLRNSEHVRLIEARQRIDKMDRELDALIQERDQLSRSKDNWESSATRMSADLAVFNKYNQDLAKTNEQLLANERNLTADNNWLTTQLKERTAKIEILNQTIYQLQETVAYWKNENEKLRKESGLGTAGHTPTLSVPTPSAEATTPAAASPIYGTVTEVKGRFASIDVGSASGIRAGMTMVVLRKSQYICDLTVTSVDPNEAVAEIVPMGGERIRVKDQVVDLNSFQARR